MTQVNSTPGQSQVAGNVVVAPNVSAPGASNTRGTAALTTVAYMQSEPGKTVNPKRS